MRGSRESTWGSKESSGSIHGLSGGGNEYGAYGNEYGAYDCSSFGGAGVEFEVWAFTIGVQERQGEV